MDPKIIELDRILIEVGRNLRERHRIESEKRGDFKILMNKLMRENGIISPAHNNSITTLPPQDALDDFMKNSYPTQINTYEIN